MYTIIVSVWWEVYKVRISLRSYRREEIFYTCFKSSYNVPARQMNFNVICRPKLVEWYFFVLMTHMTYHKKKLKGMTCVVCIMSPAFLKLYLSLFYQIFIEAKLVKKTKVYKESFWKVSLISQFFLYESSGLPGAKVLE